MKVRSINQIIIPDFQTYGQGCRSFQLQNPNPNGCLWLKNSNLLIREKGLGHILAVAAFINDIDCIGGSGGNIGFQIENDHAISIKIDPGCAFSHLQEFEQPEGRKIRTKKQDWEKNVIEFDTLPKSTQLEFLITLHEIKNTSQATIEGFFLRKGAESFIKHSDKNAREYADILLIRREVLLCEYKADLEKTIEDYKKWVIHFEEGLGMEGIAKEKELKALQQQFFYYIECNALHNDARKPISHIFEEFLFSKGKLMLIYGSAGTGKTLSLWKLHWTLVENKRNNIMNSSEYDSIFITLKSFNHLNINAQIKEIIKTNKEKIEIGKCILIMDGYDEIAGGGYKGNLYAQLQLEKFKNLKVIISCRTELITQSNESDSWFIPTEGNNYYQKCELQPFSLNQKAAFIHKFCCAEKREFTEKEYCEKIEKIEI